MKNDTLLYSLFFLISFDYLSTFIGVFYMGAIEINPFYILVNDIYYWFLIKFFAGAACLLVLVFMSNTENQKSIHVGLIILNILYIVVAINNTIQIGVNL